MKKYITPLILLANGLLLLALSIYVIFGSTREIVKVEKVVEKPTTFETVSIFTEEDILVILRAKFRNNNPEKAIEVARCESGLKYNVINISSYPFKYGLFQTIPGEKTATPDELLNPITTIEMAFRITDGGKNWKALSSKCG